MGWCALRRDTEFCGVIDSTLRPGRMLVTRSKGRTAGIPIFASLDAGAGAGSNRDQPTLVIGLAPDGGQLPESARATVLEAIEKGLCIDSGLHQFLGEDPEFASLAARHNVRIRDVRRPPDRSQLHFFSGKIDQVGAPRIAVLGTDSAIGKRTTTVQAQSGAQCRRNPQ
jgi:uncharacterized NAD-dependent epimerase/dehydratase family protein